MQRLQCRSKRPGLSWYEQQKEARDKFKKIVFIADAGTHGGRGNHEFMAGSILLVRMLNEVYSEVHAVHAVK